MLSVIFAALLAGSQVAGSSQNPFRLTPEEMARRVTRQITFSGSLSAWTETQRAEYVRHFDVQALAAKVVPNGVDVESPKIADIATGAVVATLEFDDEELNRLTIKKALMEQVLLLEQARLLPSLDQKATESLKTDVLQTVGSANAIIKKHLGDVLPGERIDQMTQGLGDSLTAMIHNPTTYSMKQHPAPGDMERLLQVFEERLALSKDRAVARLNLINVPARVDRALNDEALRATLKDREIQSIVDEVLSPLRKGLLLATSPPQLLELNKDPDRIVPGYVATVRQWSARYRDVSRKAKELARQELERERRAKEAHFQAMSMAQMAVAMNDLQVADESVAISADVPSTREAISGEDTREKGDGGICGPARGAKPPTSGVFTGSDPRPGKEDGPTSGGRAGSLCHDHRRSVSVPPACLISAIQRAKQVGDAFH